MIDVSIVKSLKGVIRLIIKLKLTLKVLSKVIKLGHIVAVLNNLLYNIPTLVLPFKLLYS